MLRVEKKPNMSLYTSGACAVAAVKGAVDMLINQEIKEETVLTLPACVRVRFKLLDQALSNGIARCAVAKKWAGVDGLEESFLIYARATKTKKVRDIVINYKKGIGRYTKKVGHYRKKDAAVTPEVKFLMKNAVLDLWEGKKVNYGVLIEISVPKGAEVAKKTVNEAYNIVGGIALTGSYGVSVKEDSQAKLDKITLSMKKARLGGATKLIFSETNHTDIFPDIGIEVDGDKYVVYKDYLYDVMGEAESTDVEGFLFINNLTNALPLACGLDSGSKLDTGNTVLAAHAAKAGVSADIIIKILSANDTRSVCAYLRESGKEDEILGSVCDEIIKRIKERFGEDRQAEVMIFTKDDGIIAKSENADELLREINSLELREVDFGKIAMEELMSDEGEENGSCEDEADGEVQPV